MSHRTIVCMLAAALVFAVGCSSEDAKQHQDKAAKNADKTASAKVATTKRSPIEHDRFDIDRVDTKRYVLDDDAVTQLLIDGIAGQINVSKVSRGYRLNGYAEDTLITRLGLNKGDVIVTINDAILTDVHQARVAFAQARKDGSFRVAIDRNGTSVQRRYYLRRLLEGQGYRSYRRRYRRRRGSVSKADYSFEKVLIAMRTGIKQLSDTHIQIDRAILVALEHHEKLLKNGLGYGGYKKGYGVEDEYSVFKELKLTKYDAITKLNGEEASSRSAIRRTLSNQASAKEFTIAVNRLTQPITIRYQVVENVVDKAALKAALEKWQADSGSTFKAFGRKSSTRKGAGIATVQVRKISDTEYEVPFKQMKDFWATITSSRGARIVPSVRSGKANGFKLYALRPNSNWAALGFKNGDTVHIVNSVVLDGALKLMDIDKSITVGLKTMTVEKTHRGRRQTITYHLK